MDQDDELSAELIGYYREAIKIHAPTSPFGLCAVCGVRLCPDWTEAYDRLAAAGQVMADDPPPWQPMPPKHRRQGEP